MLVCYPHEGICYPGECIHYPHDQACCVLCVTRRKHHRPGVLCLVWLVNSVHVRCVFYVFCDDASEAQYPTQTLCQQNIDFFSRNGVPVRPDAADEHKRQKTGNAYNQPKRPSTGCV